MKRNRALPAARQVAVLMAVAVLGGSAVAPLATAAPSPPPSPSPAAPAAAPATALAVFAGGCFWCMQPPFAALDGVLATTAGYVGGHTVQPTYAEVSRGGSGHVEAVQVRYDPARVRYETLLVTFWHNVDPTNGNGQFCDFGAQYRSAVFARTPEQLALARESKRFLELSGRFGPRLATEIVDATAGTPLYPAEAEHQDYAHMHPLKYRVYRYRCGRDEILRKLWGPPA